MKCATYEGSNILKTTDMKCYRGAAEDLWLSPPCFGKSTQSLCFHEEDRSYVSCTEHVEPSRKSDDGTARSIWSIFKINPVQTLQDKHEQQQTEDDTISLCSLLTHATIMKDDEIHTIWATTWGRPTLNPPSGVWSCVEVVVKSSCAPPCSSFPPTSNWKYGRLILIKNKNSTSFWEENHQHLTFVCCDDRCLILNSH